MGACGGAVWHGIKGWRNGARGHGIQGAYQQMVTRAPTLGGNFAVWGGLFSAFDCTLTNIRQREDPLNAIAAGALTGGVLAARAGPSAALMNAGIGGLLLGLIEGVGFVIGRMTNPSASHAPMAPGMQSSSMAAGGLGAASKPLSLSMLQPRRTLAPKLDEHDAAVQHLTLDDDEVMQADVAATSMTSKTGATSSKWRGQGPAPVIYSSAVEFSADDFTFNDNEDFDE